MPAANVPLAIEQGATFTLNFTWGVGTKIDGEWVRDDDENVIIVPYDISHCTARMQIREDYGDPVLVSITTEDGGITLGGVAGTVAMKISAEKTAVLDVQMARYDLELVHQSGDVDRLIEGVVTVDPNVTSTGSW